MPARAMWKGTLKLGLVQIPVAMFAASESKTGVEFHRLHGVKPKTDPDAPDVPCLCQTKNKVHCPACDIEVPSADLVRGFEYTKGEYVVITDDELDACKSDASSTLTLTALTGEPIDPAAIDGASYLLPQVGSEQAFETIRQALGDRRAIGTIVMRERPYLVALAIRDHGFVVYKLKSFARVRRLSDFAPSASVAVNKSEVALAKRVLANLATAFSYDASVTDVYADKVHALVVDKIQAKQDGVAYVPKASSVTMAPLSLAAALTQSLEAASAAKKAPAKATLDQKAAKPATKRRAS